MLEIFAKSASEVIGDKIPQAEVNFKTILPWVYSIMGIVGVIGIIFGSVVWVTSQGDPEKIKKGRNAVLFSTIGLVIVILATVITNFIADAGSGQ